MNNKIGKLKHLILRHRLLAAALCLLAWLLSAFADSVEDVLKGETHSFDKSLLLALRHPGDPKNPLGPLWLHEMMRDFTALGGIGVLTFVTAMAIIYLLILKKHGSALYVFAAIASGTLLTNLLKQGIDRPRPDLMPQDIAVYTASLPSGHSMMSAVVYLTLGALLASVQPNKRLRLYILAVAMLLTALIGISRVYLAMHWPSDVVAGWLGGAAWALLCWLILKLLEHRAGKKISLI
jgi:undecaprenyl-diphosphatase